MARGRGALVEAAVRLRDPDYTLQRVSQSRYVQPSDTAVRRTLPTLPASQQTPIHRLRQTRIRLHQAGSHKQFRTRIAPKDKGGHCAPESILRAERLRDLQMQFHSRGSAPGKVPKAGLCPAWKDTPEKAETRPADRSSPRETGAAETTGASDEEESEAEAGRIDATLP